MNMDRHTLSEFMDLLCGRFDNREQFEQRQAAGDTSFPFARHVNTLCNQKISGLPADFPGLFLLEESYYTVQGRTNASPHLFCFTQEADGVLLTSYDLPRGLDPKTLSYETMPKLPFDQLSPSQKFTPALYRFQDGGWVGGSESMFSPVMKFTLFERFFPDRLEVSESMEREGKRVFGYDVPLIYKRTN